LVDFDEMAKYLLLAFSASTYRGRIVHRLSQ